MYHMQGSLALKGVCCQMASPVVNPAHVENQNPDVEHCTSKASPCLHGLGGQSCFCCDFRPLGLTCHTRALQGLLHAGQQAPISESKCFEEGRARFILVNRFSSAIGPGSQRPPPCVPTRSGNGLCLGAIFCSLDAHACGCQRLAIGFCTRHCLQALFSFASNS